MDDGFSSQKIVDIVKEIKADPRIDKEHHYRDKYPEFVKKFPKLFYAAFEPAFDIRFLKAMLGQRDQVIQTKSVEKFEEVSKGVQEQLNEKYLYPVFSKEQIEQAKLLQQAMHQQK